VELAERQRTQEELNHAREAAEAANRAKSTFLANVSHEIRNPMQVILTMTELLAGPETTAKEAEYLEMVRASANSLLAVINDLLDFSKIEAGKLDLEMVPFNLGHRLGEVLKAQALRAHIKGLELVCFLDPTVPEIVVGDPNRFGQVLTNLVGNAIKFTPRGEVEVRVQSALRSADEAELQVDVVDTGIGIPRAKLQSIFQPFEQADSSTTRQYGGTGLGLSIAAKLVNLMGGQIWVDSEIGGGSIFHFTARLGLTQSSVAGLIQLDLASLRNLPVLVVDDNATNRATLVETLRNWRLKPVGLENGRAALSALTEAAASGKPFPLVVLDSQLPDWDGLTLVREMRQHFQPAPRAIVLLSTTDAPAEITRYRQLGIAGWLTKPVLPAELRALLLHATDRQAQESVRARTQLPQATATPLRVLVAEDNTINQVMMVDLLEKLGHSVTTATNGREALAVLERQPVDVVLMDVEMPELSGIEATAQIRQREKATGTHLPIIAMTAHAMTGDRERCLLAGMDGYLAKPLQAPELVETFAQMARRRPACSELRA
jgi:CheY-like chemotaxis protein